MRVKGGEEINGVGFFFVLCDESRGGGEVLARKNKSGGEEKKWGKEILGRHLDSPHFSLRVCIFFVFRFIPLSKGNLTPPLLNSLHFLIENLRKKYPTKASKKKIPSNFFELLSWNIV